MNRGEVSTSGCVRAGLEVPPDGSTKPGMGLAATPGCLPSPAATAGAPAPPAPLGCPASSSQQRLEPRGTTEKCGQTL